MRDAWRKEEAGRVERSQALCASELLLERSDSLQTSGTRVSRCSAWKGPTGVTDLGGVQSLGACPRAVEDGVASVHGERVLELGQSLGLLSVTRIGDPAVSLHQDGRS